MRDDQWDGRDAFTLPELMVATMILSIVLTSALGIFVNCSLLASSSSNLTHAMDEVQSKLDEIKNTAYDNIVTTFDSSAFNLAQPSGATGSVSVSEIGADVAADLLQVDITVNWQNKDKRSVSSTITGYVARR